MRTRQRHRWCWHLGAVLAALGTLGGCHKRRATRDDCVAVIDRLVALELTESGFRDAEVQRRWTDELRQRLAPHLSRCEGRRVPEGLRACLPQARNAEEVEHRCLR